jgi:hypothetical protein
MFPVLKSGSGMYDNHVILTVISHFKKFKKLELTKKFILVLKWLISIGIFDTPCSDGEYGSLILVEVSRLFF